MPIISEKELKKNIKGLNIFALRTDSLSVKIVLGIFVINSLRLKSFFPNRDFFSSHILISDVCFAYKGNGLISEGFSVIQIIITSFKEIWLLNDIQKKRGLHQKRKIL